MLISISKSTSLWTLLTHGFQKSVLQKGYTKKRKRKFLCEEYCQANSVARWEGKFTTQTQQKQLLKVSLGKRISQRNREHHAWHVWQQACAKIYKGRVVGRHASQIALFNIKPKHNQILKSYKHRPQRIIFRCKTELYNQQASRNTRLQPKTSETTKKTQNKDKHPTEFCKSSSHFEAASFPSALWLPYSASIACRTCSMRGFSIATVSEFADYFIELQEIKL
jgi:hypothetical protein